MFNLQAKVTFDPTGTGISLESVVTDGDKPFWSATLNYPTLVQGDVKGDSAADKNPAAWFLDLLGDISNAMSHYGLSDTDPSDTVVNFIGASPVVMHQFQGILIQASKELWQVGKQKLKSKGFDSDEVTPGNYWKIARSRKGKK